MPRQLRLTKFRDLSLADPFFDSLKEGYTEFSDWFARKADEDVYVVDDGTALSGMIYLKREDGPVTDVDPPLKPAKWLKVGTLKIVSRGTKLGERVLKKIFDTALAEEADGIYVTVFDIHESLIRLFERYGFRRYATKTTEDGVELVLAKTLNETTGDLLNDYPFIHSAGRKAWNITKEGSGIGPPSPECVELRDGSKLFCRVHKFLNSDGCIDPLELDIRALSAWARTAPQGHTTVGKQCGSPASRSHFPL